MPNALFYALISVLALAVLVPYIIASWKRLGVETSVAMHKVTTDGESLTFQTNFLKGESKEARQEKINALFEHAEIRLAHEDAKFKAHLEQERSKQAGLTAVS